jgi:integrase/recombinase XerC
VRSCVQRFLSHLRAARNLSEHTLRAYRSDLAEFERFWEARGWGAEEPSRLDRQRLRVWLSELSGRPIRRTSVLRKIAALRSLVRWLIEEDVLRRDPFLNLPMPRREGRLPRFLSSPETESLLEKGAPGDRLLDLRDRAVLELFFSSGLRRGELARLNVGDVDFVGGTVRVFGKGSRERVVPVGHAALRVLRAYLEARPVGGPERRRDGARGEGHARRPGDGLVGSSPLWLNARGGRLGEGSVAQVVRRAARKAGLLKGVTPHALRHSFATQMLGRGCDVRTLQEMLGHRSLSTTQVYTHATLEGIRRVYEKAHPRGAPARSPSPPDTPSPARRARGTEKEDE